MIVSLDVMSGLAEGLGEHFAPLIERSNIMAILCYCIQVGVRSNVAHLISFSLTCFHD